jgi:ubiquitin-like protein Pup
MPEREQIRRPSPQRTDENVDVTIATDAAKNEQLKNDLDSLLDEIDEVLEDNAEEFVRNYVQKGGE